MFRNAAALIGAAFLLIGCASPPCPESVWVSGSRSQGKTRDHSAGFGPSSGRYAETRVEAGATFSLMVHRGSCPTWSGEAAFVEATDE